MDNLRFKVSAELKNILGRDLITSPYIAILELVKNSYDAHATKVEITFDTDSIVIADNGKGMSHDDIVNKWLFVAYSAKSDGSEDLSYRSNFKRHYAGAKGIGRMSCDRLARFLTLTTKSTDSDTVESIVVDWNDFENHQKQEFSSVSVKHTSTTVPYLFPMECKTGTVLSFSGIHDNWGTSEILELRSSLEKLINPFSETDDFRIEIISPLFEAYDADVMRKIANLQKDVEVKGEDFAEKISKLRKSKVNGYIENSISDVLKIKTTQIESILKDGVVKTTLKDRGVVMYEIEELNKYPKLVDVSVNLYFLNRAAKYSFTARMGVQPVNYGNVFLFRNGFRILPYGEFNDDSWGLNQRAQQGYNRTIGTRDLFGRVDVLTNDVSEFKEVSSRDGGLISNEATSQLIEYFNETHRRLERYVTGVLWGEAFLKNEYFKSAELALEAREEIKKNKDSDSTDDVFKNIGSQVDFLQLIKSLANDSRIIVRYYNSDLADVVSNVAASDVLQNKFLDDMRKVAEKTNDKQLAENVEAFEQQLAELRRQKQEAESLAEEARQKEIAERKAKEEAERKAKSEETLRLQREKELEAQRQKTLYIAATRNTTQEVQDITHAISIASTELISLISNVSTGMQVGAYSHNDLLNKIHEAGFFANKIKQLSMLITKADIISLKNKVQVDLKEYIEEYLSNFKDSLKIEVRSDDNSKIWKLYSLLDIAIVIDNLISNSKKANANTVGIFFRQENTKLTMDFSDDGDGVDLEKYSANNIFDEGVTNRLGGSGIGLHTIQYTLETKLNGSVCFAGNGLNGFKGATFRIIFN